jgi:L-fuconolactonase
MPPCPIIDSHVHLYDPARLRYGWMAGIPVLQGAHLLPEFRAACAPVEVAGLVFVEVGADPGQHLDEARWLAALAATEPAILGMVAAAPLERGGAVEAELARLAEHRPLRAIRRLLQGEADPEFCLQPAFVEGVRLLAKLDLAFDLCIYHHQLPAVIELVRRCPEVRFVLDHMAKPGVRAGLMEPWASRLAELARLPNVACKLSGLITEADHAAWTPAELSPYLRHALDCFGPARALFGSDWPVSAQTHGYADWVGIVEAALAGCSEGEQRAVFADNARAAYRL